MQFILIRFKGHWQYKLSLSNFERTLQMVEEVLLQLFFIFLRFGLPPTI